MAANVLRADCCPQDVRGLALGWAAISLESALCTLGFEQSPSPRECLLSMGARVYG